MTNDSYLSKMIARAESYFKAVDEFNLDGILSHFTADCVLEVPTHGVRHVGLPAVRESYDRRAQTVKKSWHGDFQFIANVDTGHLAIRLKVKRETISGKNDEMDNFTLLEFDDDQIKRVSVWMAGDNSLT